MVKWAKEEGADFIVGETFYYANEALTALEEIKKSDLPAVITCRLCTLGIKIPYNLHLLLYPILSQASSIPVKIIITATAKIIKRKSGKALFAIKPISLPAIP